jgi:chromosome segregation ATPase
MERIEQGRGATGAGAGAAVAERSAGLVGSQAQQAVNLRVLLELRRRLKATAEKELAVGADRCRGLRGELRRAEAELRLCARVLEVRAEQLAELGSRTDNARARASQTCARLASLERENDDLTQQLGEAQRAARALQLSVQAERNARQGTLDSFVLAATGLINELALAAQDQRTVHARMRDLIDENQALSERASLLYACHRTVQIALMRVCENIADALGGVPGQVAAEAPAGALAVAAPPPAPVAGRS